MEIATPRRRHVTELKCITQNRYMAIDKRLELQNCTWSVSMWFQYGVKPPCAAIRVSMRHGMESGRPWGMSLYAVCMRVHKSSRVGAGGPRRISHRPTISHTYSMVDISGECAGQGSSDTRRLEECLHNPCHVWPGIVLLKYGMWSCLKEGQYLGL